MYQLLRRLHLKRHAADDLILLHTKPPSYSKFLQEYIVAGNIKKKYNRSKVVINRKLNGFYKLVSYSKSTVQKGGSMFVSMYFELIGKHTFITINKYILGESSFLKGCTRP